MRLFVLLFPMVLMLQARSLYARAAIPVNCVNEEALIQSIQAGEAFSRGSYLRASTECSMNVIEAMLEKHPSWLGTRTADGTTDLTLWLAPRPNGIPVDVAKLVSLTTPELWQRIDDQGCNPVMRHLEKQSFSHISTLEFSQILAQLPSEMSFDRAGRNLAHALLRRTSTKPITPYLELLIVKWPQILFRPDNRGFLPIHHALALQNADTIAWLAKKMSGDFKYIFSSIKVRGKPMPMYEVLARNRISMDKEAVAILEIMKDAGCDFSLGKMLAEAIQSTKNINFDVFAFFGTHEDALHYKNEKGQSLLHIAAENCDKEWIVGLRKAQLRSNETDDLGNTPLHYAVQARLLVASKKNDFDMQLGGSYSRINYDPVAIISLLASGSVNIETAYNAIAMGLLLANSSLRSDLYTLTDMVVALIDAGSNKAQEAAEEMNRRLTPITFGRLRSWWDSSIVNNADRLFLKNKISEACARRNLSSLD